MSLLTRIRARAGAGLARTRIGEAVVLHAEGGVTVEARVLAELMPADPDHELVVADLPSVAPVEVWQSFVAALPRGHRPLRVVPGRQPREVAPYVWQWLADRAGRTVLAPYGMTHHVGGALFVHSTDRSGWVRFGRGRTPEWTGKRFPSPDWESAEVGRTRAAGFRGVAEPLPSGMWIRPDVADHTLTTGRTKLTTALPCLPGSPTIVLGARDVADIEVADVGGFWRTLPPDIATAARFVRFGGVALPDGALLGQALADLVGAEVCCYTGVPAGSRDALAVLTLRQDGSLGWSTYAQAFAYRPGGAGAARLAAYRAPVEGLNEVAPGVYWYAPDIVLEVVRAGLWLRPAEQIADPAGVRAAPLDPVHSLLLYEATDAAKEDRLHQAAEELVNRLGESTRTATRLMPSTALSGTVLSAVRRTADRPPAAAPPVAAVPPAAAPPVAAAPPAAAPPVAPPPADPPPPPRPREPEPGTAAAQDTADTDLPWLSQLMETMSIPVPVRPDAEVHDDRGR